MKHPYIKNCLSFLGESSHIGITLISIIGDVY